MSCAKKHEISQGAFSRMVTLPEEVDVANAKAELKDGVLEITLPKLAVRAKKESPIR